VAAQGAEGNVEGRRARVRGQKRRVGLKWLMGRGSFRLADSFGTKEKIRSSATGGCSRILSGKD